MRESTRVRRLWHCYVGFYSVVCLSIPFSDLLLGLFNAEVVGAFGAHLTLLNLTLSICTGDPLDI